MDYRVLVICRRCIPKPLGDQRMTSLDKLTKLTILAAGLAFCPSLFAVSYTWNFASGNQGSNCTANPCTAGSAGNSILFNDTTGSPNVTVKATAYYVDSTGKL